MINAIIIGGTGATGKHLLQNLLSNNNFQKITSIGRRPVLNGKSHKKLTDIVLSNINDLSNTNESWQGNDVFFNCIGTTRKKAGGAKQFVEIELEISREAAKMASYAKIPVASLISASGANHKAWASNWIHPLLYAKTMGQKEQTLVSEFQFEKVSIFQPGMLIRLSDNGNWYDVITEKLGLGLRVDILSLAMMKEAVIQCSKKGMNKLNFYTGNKTINKLALV